MPMELSLTYKGDELYHYTPDEKQWWITGFDPSHQNVQKDEVTATVTLDFSAYFFGNQNVISSQFQITLHTEHAKAHVVHALSRACVSFIT